MQKSALFFDNLKREAKQKTPPKVRSVMNVIEPECNDHLHQQWLDFNSFLGFEH